MAPVHTHTVVKRIQPLSLLLITRVGNPTVRLEEDGGSKVLFGVPPVRGAGGAAAGAKNAFVKAIKFAAVGG